MTTPTPLWTVNGLTPFTQFIAGQGPISGWNVNFLTNAGVSGSVFVSDDRLPDKAYVAQLIGDRVSHLHTILNLTPPTGR